MDQDETPATAADAPASLSEVRNRRLVGARFASGRVTVPAQDFCPESGEENLELVEAPGTGTLTGFTQTSAGVIATIRIDGADFDMVHRIQGSPLPALRVGDRVEAVWLEEERTGSLSDIAHFEVIGDEG